MDTIFCRPQGENITVVNSRGVKRQSLESSNVVPVKQAKQDETVPMVMLYNEKMFRLIAYIFK